MIRSILASALAGLITLTACQGQRPQDDEQPAADTQIASGAAPSNAQPGDSATGSMSVPPAAADTAPTPARALQDTTFAGTTEPIHRTRRAPPVTVLHEVRTAAHETFDRIVFEFADEPLPGYHVEYAAGPVYQCGSGDEVSVAGDATLVVRLEAAQAHDDQGNVTIAERRRVMALPVLKELTIICDFEAQVEWVVGLAARKPYRVEEISEPPRLIL
ncbi:MAG: hypothetical protein PVJ43_11525, partial [Gemmatimonadales bacterium]